MSSPQVNGTTTPANTTQRAPPVVGINFGNSYASIAILNKDGVPDCIANEDGERQIATALSFHGEEMYIGNQAKPQLVKNSKNTIVGFRNLLGKSYGEATSMKSTAAPIVEHKHEPAYTVQVLEPAPAPPSIQPTPKGSHAPTPLQSPPPELAEPSYISKTLTVSDVASTVLGSLVNSASDFLGQRIQGAVITVPARFPQKARDALSKAAEHAGVHVLQLLDDAAAASLAYSSLTAHPTEDRTSLILDLGASSLDLTLLSTKQGLVHSLASSHIADIGGDAIDDRLIAFFAKEFTKKTKVPLSPTSSDPADVRALTKLRLAVEHTKRTLSASPGAASCSVESLKDGLDFSGTINRLRFDIEMKPIYTAVSTEVKKLLESANLDPVLLDEVILVGGTALLPGLSTQLSTVLEESTEIRADIDPSQVLSRGAAVQAGLLFNLGPNDPLLKAFHEDCKALDAHVTTKPISAYFPSEEGSEEICLPLIASETPLPARRTVSFVAQLAEKEGEQALGIEIWQVNETVKVEKTKLEVDPEDEEEEEPEEIETRHRVIEKDVQLGALKMDVVGSRAGKKKKGPLQATIMLTIVINLDHSVEVLAHQKDSSAAPVTLKL
ncbi:SubName: Full=Related to SSZ1-regulator protein involved in pleiotropic drug resistance {ECO:0000313/EMBL:CCA73223.1} [Serendipita indica DSM 11827]|uniref:Related to SSZ1-regulator protein involved in pleiotropic drug resistance n=1 Tax=Serendipita indica (strain DSM 11827) TaxID=1109443 RepID=G4TPI0_SERID|nr:SubName: Full=Related to SSZ1-regulator protein involved in pleiotropic drug resistance {ECO:0000313/EMBL:CCA73223.1} [Serendipita indica DSM 11827]CCA73223.1 related to SSZ1-regulator protein involved in pleiotropic drug resistance [Serendipita indica DSM 11827]